MSELRKLVLRYIGNVERAFETMQILLDNNVLISKEKVGEIVDYAMRYLKDSKYYFDRNRFEVALASVVYCEGLLDALRLLGLVKFEWLTEK